MNETDRGKLLRDVMATGLAARKRRRRKLKGLAIGSCSAAAACLLLTMKFQAPEESLPGSDEMARLEAGQPPGNQPQQTLPAKIPTEQEKEEALLITLSEAGPVIITMADGSRQLYLTRPGVE